MKIKTFREWAENMDLPGYDAWKLQSPHGGSETCPACEGEGQLDGEECPVCKGAREVDPATLQQYYQDMRDAD